MRVHFTCKNYDSHPTCLIPHLLPALQAEDLDGVPLADDDIDGVPLEKEDIDGEPRKSTYSVVHVLLK